MIGSHRFDLVNSIFILVKWVQWNFFISIVYFFIPQRENVQQNETRNCDQKLCAFAPFQSVFRSMITCCRCFYKCVRLLQ